MEGNPLICIMLLIRILCRTENCSVMSLFFLLFADKPWPIILGAGIGTGMGISDCNYEFKSGSLSNVVKQTLEVIFFSFYYDFTISLDALFITYVRLVFQF